MPEHFSQFSKEHLVHSDSDFDFASLGKKYPDLHGGGLFIAWIIK